LSAAAALVIAVILAPQLNNLGQVFQYIQEYTGIVSPGILAIFLLGLFWKKTTNRAAIVGALFSIIAALYFKVGPNEWSDGAIFVTLPFMTQMLWTCISTMIVMMLVSLAENKGADNEKGIPLSKELFATGRVFNTSATIVILILIVLYFVFW